ncbi:bifunctional DNA-formamidopyrimidine glycosylase/DNA-(apurinic or apyrimidinic site) lyase [Pseudovibrio sp. Tun.PSC04-5.I4]|uniref:bifunctional DNA-formamidopyrimidine glycosylase/DNA-(apurinic or apyrimidinic site) lyase n=1 Tax=Pseudovibrio sp. Tun.PSC04-5.I4 TaxID=1798213 RepID=UPI0008800AB8|nr:bifunctional DNA-formamidopyrimidine glycosylase/DNA-(apurinic or apyrimidinic site) lyase [Pseudovibrio sp. Tun.PSC04-5.I4]SDR25035.1 DNA-(apurinic or apyrimidinic site) lyase [Pseudovibrio sp. Tun.PSC04-5.I4]
MPELPEVETVRRGLAPFFDNATICRVEQRRPDLRFPFGDDFVERIENRQVVSFTRRAKYLLLDLDSGDVLVMHLGMSGSFRWIETDDAEPQQTVEMYHAQGKHPQHDHVVFHVRPAEQETIVKIVYNDPRRFGFMILIPRSELAAHPMFAEMGIEPLGNELDGAYLANLFGNRKTTLKAALLNQKFVAGLGNIYVCEALWRAGLNPFNSAGSLSGKSGKSLKKADELSNHIREVLQEAIASGGSSLKDHRQADGSLGYFQHNFSVYGREGEACKTTGCSGVIERKVQHGRSTFFCPQCQK